MERKQSNDFKELKHTCKLSRAVPPVHVLRKVVQKGLRQESCRNNVVHIYDTI